MILYYTVQKSKRLSLRALSLSQSRRTQAPGYRASRPRSQADTAKLLHSHENPCWVSSSLGVMRALLGKLDLLLQAHQGCSSRRVKEKVRLLKDDVEELSSYLDELLEVEDPPPMARCWMNEARDLSYDMEDYIDSLLLPDQLNNKQKKKRKKRKKKRSITSHVKIPMRLKWCKRITYLSQVSEDGNTRSACRNIHVMITPSLHKNMTAPEMISQFRIYVQDAIERYDRYKLHCCSTLRRTSLSTGHMLPSPYEEVDTTVIDDRMNEFINSLVGSDAGDQQQLKVVSVLGSGCLGKTTLAKVLYNRIGMQFDCRAFVLVSKKPDMKSLLRDLYSQLHHRQPLPANSNELVISDNISKYLQDKRYLIIIDDLWDASVWDSIKYVFPKGVRGSRIITTTQTQDVALTCCCDHPEHVFEMKPLQDDQARMLFFNRLFGSENDCPVEFKQVSNEIVDICGGLPLAIINIASHLANQTAVSLDLLTCTRDSLRSHLGSKSISERTRQVLNLSYNNLPHYLKTCLLYLHMYRESSIICKDDLVKQWVAEGFITTSKGNERDQDMMEKDAGMYFDELIDRRFIQPVCINYKNKVLSCSVHDVVHDLIAHKSAEENFILAVDCNRNNIALSHKVRRLSLIFGNAKYAKTPANIRKSQVRSLRFFGLFECMPCIREFKLLRVLNLQLSDHHDDHELIDLTGISELFQLRYLKVASDVCIKLPNRMQGLKCLETLDVIDATKVTAVPWDIIHLPYLIHLTLPIDTYLLDWIGSMSDSVSSLWSLGKLNYLQDLHLTSSSTSPSYHLERSMEALGYLLGGHENLKTIVVTRVSSKNSVVRGAPKVTVSWDRMSPPPLLQRFECSRNSCIIFYRIPRWIGELGNLCVLKIALKELRMICVGTLGGLRALTDMYLYVETAPIDKIIFDKAGFSVLKYLKLRFRTGIAWLEFEAGAMPNLWRLKLLFNAIPRMDQNLVFFYHDRPAIHQCGAAVIRIEHMPGLKEVSVKFGGTVSDLEYALRAVINHPSNPTIDIQLVVHSSNLDGSKKRKQPYDILNEQPDEHDKRLDRPTDKRISTSTESSWHLHDPEITPRLMQITDNRLDKVLTPIGDLKRLVIQHTEKYFTLDGSSTGKDRFEDRGGARHQETIMVSDAMLSNPKLQQPSSHDHEHLPPPAKKHSLPSAPDPDPDTEVIALSPQSLMAKNRFVCEICGTGFQREHNLQLHRRGHNLPWKLRQQSGKEPRKAVYVCPEESCVHHNPSRGLQDLTAIRKHFCRKHGEKMWKCDKCDKRYALQSDWRAHSKVCGASATPSGTTACVPSTPVTPSAPPGKTVAKGDSSSIPGGAPKTAAMPASAEADARVRIEMALAAIAQKLDKKATPTK